MPTPEALELVRKLDADLAGRSHGRSGEVAHLVAWMRAQLDIVADALTPPHGTNVVTLKGPRRTLRALN